MAPDRAGATTRPRSDSAGGNAAPASPQLVIDAAFESGNLAEARLVSESPLEYDLHIRPDTLNERHRVWFFFTARCTAPATRALLHVVGYSKTKSLFRDGMAPIVRSSAAAGWERMPSGSAYFYRSPRHGQRYVLSFPFFFDSPGTTYAFAYCYPYTYSYLQRFLASVEARGLRCCRRSLLARSVQGRRLDLLTISSPANLATDAAHERGILQQQHARKQDDTGTRQSSREQDGLGTQNGPGALGLGAGARVARTGREGGAGMRKEGAVRGAPDPAAVRPAPPRPAPSLSSLSFCGAMGAEPRPVPAASSVQPFGAPPLLYLFISARVHPGETPASFVMHGLIRFLLSDEPAAVALREVAVLKVVPMLCPDGVFLGNYRTNALGLDLNRMWAMTAPWGAPTIHAVRELAQAYTQRPGCDVRLFLDIHAHSTTMAGFVYANAPGAPWLLDQVSAFPRALASHCRDLSFDRTKFCADPAKAGTGRRAMGRMLPTVHCYSLEVSFFCAAGPTGRGECYTPSSYLAMGSACGRALTDIAISTAAKATPTPTAIFSAAATSTAAAAAATFDAAAATVAAAAGHDGAGAGPPRRELRAGMAGDGDAAVEWLGSGGKGGLARETDANYTAASGGGVGGIRGYASSGGSRGGSAGGAAAAGATGSGATRLPSPRDGLIPLGGTDGNA